MKLDINNKRMKHLFNLACIMLISFGVRSQCTLVCNADIFVSLDANGLAEISPDMIIEGDTTGCNFDLLLSVTLDGIVVSGPTVTLTCDHIGEWTVTMTDLTTGNSCWSTINLQDPGGFCDFGAPALVATGQCFSDVDLLLNGTETLTGNCVFLLPELSGEEQTVTIIDNGGSALNGVSTLDWVLMFRGIINNDFVPRTAIATDIDNDGTVSTVDLITHRQIVLGLDDGSSYDQVRMYRQDNPFDNFSPYDMLDYTSLEFDSSEFETVNSILIRFLKVGDLNDSAFGGINSDDITELRSIKELIFEDRFVQEGEEVEFILSIESPDVLNGLTASLNVEGEWLNVSTQYSDFEFMTNVVDGNLKCSFLNSSDHEGFGMTLKYIADQAGFISDHLSLEESFINDVVTVDDQSLQIGLRAESSSFSSEVQLNNSVGTYDSVLSFGNEFAGQEKTIEIRDMQGRLIEQKMTVDNTINIYKTTLGHSGMYLVNWSCNGKRGVEKIIMTN